MAKLLLIGLAGFMGVLLRYLIGGQVQALPKSVFFAYGTLAVNVIGCLLIGFLSYWLDSRASFNVDTRDILMVGLLGAFTTFSSFSLETINLLFARQFFLALANTAANNLLGLGAVWLGRVLPLAIWSGDGVREISLFK